MEQVKNISNLPISIVSSDLMDRALIELELNNYNTDTALENMTKLNKDDFKHAVEWSQQEVDAFEQSIRENGHDLNFAKRDVSIYINHHHHLFSLPFFFLGQNKINGRCSPILLSMEENQ
jgi:hypothetical protein